jgi:2-polyprenyl-3-methyl-5-hydroxy-6-metoxy-1,4-benzoquinol methylase
MPQSEISYDSVSDKCHLCNSKDIYHFITDYRGVKIFKCRKCKTRFINPLYSDKYLSELYNTYNEHDLENIDTSKMQSRDIKHEFNLKQIEKYISPGNILSVGCGNGIELGVAIKRGWKPEGYEINQELVKELTKLYRVQIYSGEFSELELKKNHYDCIYFNHVIEHTKKPHNYLRRITGILKPGGILYIATPNINGIANKIKGFISRMRLTNKPGKYYDSWQHLFYFSPANLKYLLEEYYNFSVISISNDLKLGKNSNTVRRNIFDFLCYKTSFRILAVKVS